MAWTPTQLLSYSRPITFHHVFDTTITRVHLCSTPCTRGLSVRLWWLICAMSYYRVFGAKRRKGATRNPAKWWLFRVFAWRPFAPPHDSSRHSMRCVFGYCLSYLSLARRKVAMRKPDKIIFWRVFAWRPFAFSPRKHVYTTWYKSATIVR